MGYGEFDLIAYYFNRANAYQAGNPRRDVELGIGDDCALLSVADKQLLAVSTDTLVSGVHFLPTIDPADLGYKSLAVNLSDLAAMGANPAWLSLALTLPEINSAWLAAYSDSLFTLLDYYSMQLIGGDTTRGPLSLTLTTHGLVPDGRALTRAGARIGDWIYVTGTLGDSAAGLAILQQHLRISDSAARQSLVQRHLRPQPSILQGQALRALASSAIDLSDGLISDLCHILDASDCGAHVQLDAIPYSSAMIQNVEPDQALRWALSGGEDYELCFTVPEINRGALDMALGQIGVGYTCIGKIAPFPEGLRFFDGDNAVELNWKGYDHFSQ